MLIPIIRIGVIIDIILFNFSGVVTIIATAIAFSFYIVSFVLSLMVLKTEVKAQERALTILKEENMATEEEREMMKKLFKLYNIDYVNQLIIELLQLILRILMLIAKIQGSSSSSSSSN
jgi:Zn-dependent membrane protease YugP